MQSAQWLASIFGPFMAIVGLWMLLYSNNLIKVYSGVKSSPSTLYFRGILNLLVGLTILSNYDYWSLNPEVLVTLLGWMMVIRGILTLFMPQLVIRVMENNEYSKVKGLIPLVWGLALCWVAYIQL